MGAWLRWLLLGLLPGWFLACASVPRGQYGVAALSIEGAEQLSEDAIERCLLTMERDRVGLVLGVSSSGCRAPPFDHSPPRLELWRWPWTDWPTLNVAVLEVDRQRIERFYRARGFYDARVVEVRYDPPRAADPAASAGAEGCDPSNDSCTVEIRIVVQEGQPLTVGRVEVSGLESLSEAVQGRVLDEPLLEPGARFDELDYDRGKQRLLERLAEESYAQATVHAQVRLDHPRKLAHASYRVELGSAYRFGEVRVAGQGALPSAPIIAAAGVEQGGPYQQSALAEVQREVYALGAFSSVEVDREIDALRREVHLRVQVRPLEPNTFRVGVGVTSGALQRVQSQAVESVPQWDTHLLGRYERRHVFGSLGKLRIEDQPRLIFGRPFPELRNEQLGNVLTARLTEPALIEARTKLVVDGLWDYGPDPFRGFLRWDIAFGIGLERAFLRRSLSARIALQHDRYLVNAGQQAIDGKPVPDSYAYSFLEQELRLDLRDDEVRPRQGAWFSLRTAESVRMPLSDWTLFQIVPDARAFLPLPFEMTLALRVALAALLVSDPRPDLDPVSRALGPNAYRLRGGGAQSNRGFVAGELGVGIDGGVRRWESSVELRLRLGNALGVTLFYDMGDVNNRPRFRFDEVNPSLGFGLRYSSPVGTLRGDLGFRVGTLDAEAEKHEWFGQPGALHITIGEAF
ncbi:MAG: BamA/TamA family outer membrane protein [Deltaproteobacteria bacterium]